MLMDLFLQLRRTIYDRGDKLHFSERQTSLYFKLQMSTPPNIHTQSVGFGR